MITRALLMGSLAVAPLLAQQQPAQAPASLPADWAQRDLEGKWVAYRAAVDTSDKPAETAAAWALALGAAREFELLEQIAIHEGWRHVGRQLERNGAPQWMRAALWNLGAYDSHDKDGANQVLLQHGPEVLAWFRTHPQAAQGKAATLRDKLVEQQVTAAESTDQLPPLEPLPFLVPQLDPPARLVEFGSRTRAEPGVRYVHQVRRALGAVIAHGEADDLIVRKVLTLTLHANTELSRDAYATLGRLPPGRVPGAQLLEQVDDATIPAARRRLATLALSFSAHPRAFFRIEALAREVGHPGHEIAVARLAEIGDTTTDPAVFGEQAAHARVFRSRLQSGAANQAMPVRHLLWRMAWLRRHGDPRAAAHEAAAAAILGPQVGPQNSLSQAVAAVLGDPPEPSPFRGDEERQVLDELQRWIATQGR